MTHTIIHGFELTRDETIVELKTRAPLSTRQNRRAGAFA
jgi:hypothetical protein